MAWASIAQAAQQGTQGMHKAWQSYQTNKYNQKIAEQNAEIAKQQGEAAVDMLRRKQSKTIGKAEADYASSGVSGGSAIDVLAQAAAETTLDRLTMKYNYDLRVRDFKNQSDLLNAAKKNSKTSMLFQGGGALGSGYASYSKSYGGGQKSPWSQDQSIQYSQEDDDYYPNDDEDY